MAKTKKAPAAKQAAPAPAHPRADSKGWVLCPGDHVLVVSPGEEHHGLFGRVDTFPTKLELSCYVQLDGRPSTTGRVLLPNAQLRWMGPDEAQVENQRPTRPGQQVRVVLENEALATPEMKSLEGKLGSVTDFSYAANDVTMVTVKFEDPDLAPWPTAIYSYDLLVVPLPVVQYVPEPVPVEPETNLPMLDDKAPAEPFNYSTIPHFTQVRAEQDEARRQAALSSVLAATQAPAEEVARAHGRKQEPVAPFELAGQAAYQARQADAPESHRVGWATRQGTQVYHRYDEHGATACGYKRRSGNILFTDTPERLTWEACMACTAIHPRTPAAPTPAAPAATPAKPNTFEAFQDATLGYKAGLRILELASIVITRNTRQVFDEASLAELAQSIRAKGIIQPIVVRPYAAEFGKFELVCGARRVRAARLAELVHVPATVRVGMDEREFLEVQLLENLQRVDVRPADEAQAFAELLANGYSAEEIGLKVGKGEKFVLQRAKLTELSTFWMDLLIEERLPLVAAHELARLPSSGQHTVALAFKDSWSFQQKQPISANDVRNTIGRIVLRELDKAVFPKDDASLYKKAGACVTCPKRSGACRGLFDELAGADKSDTCLDAACFNTKRDLFVARQLEAVAFTNTPVISESYDSPPKGALGYKHYSQAKKGEAGAVQALLVDGTAAGSMKWVKLSTTAAQLPVDRKAEREAAMRKNRLGRMKNELWAGKLRDTFVEELHHPHAPHGDAAAQALLDHWLRRSFTFGRTRTPNDMLSYLAQHYGWQEPAGEDLDNSYQSKGQNGHDRYLSRQLATMSALDKVGLFFDLMIRSGLEQSEVCAGQYNLVQALPKSYQPAFDITQEAEQAVEARYYTKKGKKQEAAV